MNERGMEKLRAFLFRNGRKLVNIKFFPGTGRGLTADQMGAAAEAALASALASDMKNLPPKSGRKASTLVQFLTH